MISKENETDRFQPFQHIGVKLKAICTDFTHHVKSLLKARFFGTKTAVLNVRLVLSYEENFTQIYFGSKTTVLNVRLPPPLWRKRETLPGAAAAGPRYLGFPRTRLIFIVLLICCKEWEEISHCSILYYQYFSIALAAFLVWVVEAILSKVSASRACKASSGSHRDFRCFLGSRFQYSMIQNTVLQLLGSTIEYSMTHYCSTVAR